MVTRKELAEMEGYGYLHWHGIRPCKEKPWKVWLCGKLEEQGKHFRQPARHGIGIALYIDNSNANEFHKAENCPVNDKPKFRRKKNGPKSKSNVPLQFNRQIRVQK